MRVLLSKKARFDVFKRDDFVCQYCGARPPNVVLEVDHINPISNGGDNSASNLITSCFDCNRGKSDRLLGDVILPLNPKEKSAIIREAEDQINAYREIIIAREGRIESDCWVIIDILFSATETTKMRFASVRRFVEELPLDEVMDAARIARRKKPYARVDMFSYFCGVCWRKINNSKSDGAAK